MPTLLAGAACIGFAPILVRLSEVGPSATAFYRVLLALPVLGWWMCRENRCSGNPLQRPAVRRDFPGLVLAGLFFTGDLSVWHWSLQHTTVANSTLLTNFAPLFVTVGAWLILGEKITPTFLLSLSLALGGAFLLVGAGRLEWAAQNLLGDSLALLAALFYGAYLLMVKQLRRALSGLTIMFYSGLVACPGFMVVGALLGEDLWPGTPKAWMVLIGLGVVSQLGGQTLIAIALGRLPASYSSLGLLLQPVLAAFLAWALFQEALAGPQILGGLIILAGIALGSRKPA